MLKSRNLSYERMKLEDVYQFKNWGRHRTVLLNDYNFYEETDEDIKSWFQWKTHSSFNFYYTIFLGDKAIGYISFKNTSSLLKRTTLGLVLDPNFINCGYGTEALVFMLNYFINEKNISKVVLKVAGFNKRAKALYEKVGFEKVSTSIFIYDNGDYDESISDYRDNKESFFVLFGKTFFYADKMILNRKKFDGVVKCISNFKI